MRVLFHDLKGGLIYNVKCAIYNYDPYLTKFQFVVKLVRNSVEKRDTATIIITGKVPTSRSGIVASCQSEAYRTVASMFGIGNSTAVEIKNSFIHALNELYKDWITFPASVQETGEAIQRFSDNNLFNILQILGAIDGSHIPIKSPKHNKESYFNRMHFNSMNLKAVDGRFLDISAGFPGSIHDSRVLRMSGLYGRLPGNDILQGPYINLNSVSIGPLIVGDSIYPLFP